MSKKFEKKVPIPDHIKNAVLSESINEILEEINGNLKEDYENVLNENVTQYATEGRQVPQYAPGFLDKPFLENGLPTREKDLLVYKTVMSGNFGLIELEGGVRGGKDVILLYCWSKYLMVCPDTLHLALGSSLEHVLRTVLLSGGFGLFYTIPNGTLIRETISGGQRGIYKFQDAYGREKQILFYGNEKENDGNKFQGFTIGSVYVNETLNQHLKGLEQAINRMASVKRPLMVMTQNPKGANHDYYQKFEKAKLTTNENIDMMEFIANTYKADFEKLENELLEKCKQEKKEQQRLFIASKNKSSKKMLSPTELKDLIQLLIDITYKYDKLIRSFPVQRFFKHIKKGDYLYDRSMKKVVNFFRGAENPNGIQNAYDFAYFHYNVDDNMVMSEMDRNDFKNKRLKGTAEYDQEVIGLRRTSSGSVYQGFTQKNIFKGDITDLHNVIPNLSGMRRICMVDPGFNHPTGIIDLAFDDINHEIWQIQERHLDFNKETHLDKENSSIIQEATELMRSAWNRKFYDAVIVDPSDPTLISAFRNQGFNVMPADNTNYSQTRKEKEESEELQKREMKGVPLVQEAFYKNKIHIHEDCTESINQITSYAYVEKGDGKTHLPTLGDDLVVLYKYAVNTLKVNMAVWSYGKDTIYDEEHGTTSNTTDEEFDFYKFLESIQEKKQEEEFDENNFFNGGTNWFN